MSGATPDRDWASAIAARLSDAYEITGEAHVALTVSGSPEGDVTLNWSSVNGAVTADAGDSNADLAMTVGKKEFDRIIDGDLSPSVAYMQGKLKSTGDSGLLIDLLKASSRPEFSSVISVD